MYRLIIGFSSHVGMWVWCGYGGRPSLSN